MPAMIPTSIEIGARIRTVRKRLRMKQTEMAKLLNVSGASISGYELGDISPPVDALIRIAVITDTSLEWLILGAQAGLDRDEQLLVDLFRGLDPERKKRILQEAADYSELSKANDARRF